MVTEKTIYVCNDGMRFDELQEAQDYNNDYLRLKPLYDVCLGEPLKYPEIFCGYCLDSIQHSKEDIVKIIIELTNVVRDHTNAYDTDMKDYDYFKNIYNDILESVKDMQEHTIKQDIQHAYKYGMLDKLWRWAGCTYMFKDSNYQYEKTIVSKILDRLKNISFVTGIEYPNDGHNWPYCEEKWPEFVKYHKKYIAEGGKYR